jgi:enoyl-CoA hydratase/carnithine racemase
LIEDLGGGVRLITLNRPNKRNAIHMEMYSSIKQALEQADRDQTVQVQQY